jgi:hypothetical protein
MEKIHFCEEEVVSYLENKILDQAADQDELELYQNFKWNGKFEKTYTYKKVIHRMRELYNEIF